jgi:hypothetical protein
MDPAEIRFIRRSLLKREAPHYFMTTYESLNLISAGSISLDCTFKEAKMLFFAEKPPTPHKKRGKEVKYPVYVSNKFRRSSKADIRSSSS